MNAQIKLGSKARDTITGFSGTVVAITEWLNGCRRITIQPNELRDGKPIDTFTFDVEQVEEVEAAPPAAVPGKRPGGPKPEPARAAAPR